MSTSLGNCVGLHGNNCGSLQNLITLATGTQAELQSAISGGQTWDAVCTPLQANADKIQDALKGFDPKEAPAPLPSQGSTPPMSTTVDGFVNDSHEYSYELGVVCTADQFKYDSRLVNQFGTRAQQHGAALLAEASRFQAQYCPTSTAH